MVPPIDAPATVPIDPSFVVMGVACEEELLIAVDELVDIDIELVYLGIELVVDDCIDSVLVEDLDEEAIVVTDELMLALSVKWY